MKVVEHLVKRDLDDYKYEYFDVGGSVSPIGESITEDTCYLQYADECDIKLLEDSSCVVST